ncbi:hypothetical protein [Streptomyces sp. NPDC058486]|uniref:hypothetical protein n=1 Tax=unclassified Streptomyces TaxID=2593676 RepID=UPI003653B63D
MPENQTPESFLTAVDNLRAGENTVRATAHTSSVSAEGWTAVEPNSTPEGAEV